MERGNMVRKGYPGVGIEGESCTQFEYCADAKKEGTYAFTLDASLRCPTITTEGQEMQTHRIFALWMTETERNMQPERRIEGEAKKTPDLIRDFQQKESFYILFPCAV